MSEKAQTMDFQAEVKQMLHLVIHSMYSNKEIFLRELISNASDALDKLRFLALSDNTVYENNHDLKIVIDVDSENKTITLKDNGIGMSKDEAIANLGTIAKSGTREFISHLTGEQAKDSQLIGQFGVGFYSAFIVADKVTVKTRRALAKPTDGVVWTSAGDGTFTIEPCTKSERGTEITLHLKKDEEEFASDWRLRSIISKYSDHICWPIEMKTSKLGDEKEEKTTPEYETVNKATALWTQQKSEISDEQYQELYKHISHDFEAPLTWTHNHVEGKQEYISLLYIPARAPFDLWNQENKHGLKLYVKRVFIMDEASQFLPRYLRFVRGIIDSADLPLNVSRELLQDNRVVESIRSACTKRVLNMIEKLSEDNEKYQTFWNEFGLVMKEGPVEDYANRETVAKLLRFASTHAHSDAQNVSLTDYVSRMQEGQDKIYYITASSYNAAKNSPHLEIFRKKGIEVLLLSDKIDEWLVGYLSEFDGKKLQSVSKGKLDVEENQEALKEQEKDMESIMTHIKKVLGDKAKDVALTNRLTDSPACVVADDQDMGLEMQRILKAAGQDVPVSKPIFEINPSHKLIKQLQHIQDDELFENWVNVLFDQAVLAEGGQLDNPVAFIARMNQLLEKSVLLS